MLVPFNVACGSCYFCNRELFGNCHDTNPEATAVGAIHGGISVGPTSARGTHELRLPAVVTAGRA